jgi:AraC-like DNA-binding protein
MYDARPAVEEHPALVTVRPLAGGADWRVRELVCHAGPASPKVEEQHEWTGVAVVASGTFTYRSDAGRVFLSPGALLLGNAGACFECGHDHGTGDVCISFHYSPAWVEQAYGQFRCAPRQRFARHVVPPLSATVACTARALAIAHPNAGADAGELAVELLQTAVMLAHGDPRHARLDARALRLVSSLVRQIDASPQAPWSLATLAEMSGLDEFRLLRSFKRVTAVTPYQYVLRQRLQSAARCLLQRSTPVYDIALSCGFGDLSEFNRRFRKHAGMSPTQFRRVFVRGPQGDGKVGWE